MCKIYEIEIPVKGVTFREQAVKNACEAIANYNNVIDKDDYYGARTYSQIKDDLISMEQELGHAYIYKYDGMTFSDIELIPEPDNRKDQNAIKILIFGYHVGYVPKEKTLFLKRYMNNNNYIINKVGKIVGGPFKELNHDTNRVITQNHLSIGFRITLTIELVNDTFHELCDTIEMNNSYHRTDPFNEIEPIQTQPANYITGIDILEAPKKEIQPSISFKQQLKSIENKTIYNNITHGIKNIDNNINYNETVIDKLINKWYNFTDRHPLIYQILIGIVWISSKIIIGIGYLTMMMIGGFFGAFFSALKESSKSSKKKKKKTKTKKIKPSHLCGGFITLYY